MVNIFSCTSLLPILSSLVKVLLISFALKKILGSNWDLSYCEYMSFASYVCCRGFLPVCGFFHFLNSVFHTAEVIHFDEFLLWIMLFRVISNKSLPNPRPLTFRFLFSSRSFITFRCMSLIPLQPSHLFFS